MRFALTLFLLAQAVTLPGCRGEADQPVDRTAVYCRGGDNTRPWRQLDEPPPNAAALRLLADATGLFPDGAATQFEHWIALPTGELRLCRGAGGRLDHLGAWWEFSAGPNPVIVNSDAWEIVTVG